MSIANTFWDELVARLKALPEFGVRVERIKRTHRTVVTRENSPAIHVIEGKAKPTEDKRCDWQWQMDGTITVYVRDDAGLAAADDFMTEIVDRINPEKGTPYSNNVRLQVERITPETEIADEDATAVSIELSIKYGTRRWTLDVSAG